MTSFAPVDGCPGYIVSSDGAVYGPEGAVRLGKYSNRYHCVNICGKTLGLHRVVAEAHIPNPEGKPDVAHCDNDGHNNHIHNLRWATEAENMADKVAHGTHTVGDLHGNTKLRDHQVFKARRLKSEGWKVDELASHFGVSRWTIYDACNPKRRKTLTQNGAEC